MRPAAVQVPTLDPQADMGRMTFVHDPHLVFRAAVHRRRYNETLTPEQAMALDETWLNDLATMDQWIDAAVKDAKG